MSLAGYQRWIEIVDPYLGASRVRRYNRGWMAVLSCPVGVASAEVPLEEQRQEGAYQNDHADHDIRESETQPIDHDPTERRSRGRTKADECVVDTPLKCCLFAIDMVSKKGVPRGISQRAPDPQKELREEHLPRVRTEREREGGQGR